MMGMVFSRFCYEKIFVLKHIIIDGRGFFAANVGIEASKIKDGGLDPPRGGQPIQLGTVWETNHRQMSRMITLIFSDGDMGLAYHRPDPRVVFRPEWRIKTPTFDGC